MLCSGISKTIGFIGHSVIFRLLLYVKLYIIRRVEVKFTPVASHRFLI